MRQFADGRSTGRQLGGPAGRGPGDGARGTDVGGGRRCGCTRPRDRGRPGRDGEDQLPEVARSRYSALPTSEAIIWRSSRRPSSAVQYARPPAIGGSAEERDVRPGHPDLPGLGGAQDRPGHVPAPGTPLQRGHPVVAPGVVGLAPEQHPVDQVDEALRGPTAPGVGLARVEEVGDESVAGQAPLQPAVQYSWPGDVGLAPEDLLVRPADHDRPPRRGEAEGHPGEHRAA